MRNKALLLGLLVTLILCGCAGAQFKAQGESAVSIGAGSR